MSRMYDPNDQTKKQEEEGLLSASVNEGNFEVVDRCYCVFIKERVTPVVLGASSVFLCLLSLLLAYTFKTMFNTGSSYVAGCAQALAPNAGNVLSDGCRERWLDGCQHVYLDVGSNVGIQMRKVFEPELYPNAEVLPFFDIKFGHNRADRSDICAVGFEANPIHTQRLKALETAYTKKGWRIKINTETAVSVLDGSADFYLDTKSASVHNQWGASLLNPSPTMPKNSSAKAHVRTLDLARYIMQDVISRQLQNASAPAFVLMKLDVEGYEHVLLPHLIVTGALCHINAVFAELHAWGKVKLQGEVEDETLLHAMMDFVSRYDAESCPVELVPMDDESYDWSHFPLPHL